VGAINNSNYRDIIINKFNLTEKNFENNIRKDLVVEKSMLTLLKFVKKFKFFKAKEIFDIQRNKSILSFIKFNLNRIVFNFFYKDIEYWRNKNKCNIVKWINFNSKKYSRNNSFGINHIFLKIKKNYTKKLINPGKKILKLYRIMNYKNNFNFLLNKMSEDFVFLKKQKIKYFKMKNISNQFWNLLIRIDNENKEKWSKVIRSNFGYHIIDNIHTKKGFNLDLKEKFYLLLEDMFKNRKLKYRIKKITINMALFLKGTFIKNDFKIEKILVNYIKKITTRYLYPISNYIKKIKKSKYILFDVFELKSKNMFILKNNCNNNYFIISDVIRKNLKLKNKVKNNTFVKFFIFSNKEVFFNSFIDWLKEKSIIKYNKFFNIT
jgi:hypothetical protein